MERADEFRYTTRSSTATGWCLSVRCSAVGGRPMPEYGSGGWGRLPCGHACAVFDTWTAYLSPRSVRPLQNAKQSP